MDTSWLDVLSGLDKMVLGSIVGSVILAFLLLIVVFSVKIKSQQDRIALLRSGLAERSEELQTFEAMLSTTQRKESDAQTLLEHYQEVEEAQEKREQALREKLKKAHDSAQELQRAITKLQEEKEALAQAFAKLEHEHRASREEVAAVLKRNEFWVEQLSELRTKHEALKLKLRKGGQPV